MGCKLFKTNEKRIKDAIKSNNIVELRELCEHSASINIKGSNGKTPLHYVLDRRPSLYGNEERVLEMVQYLVSRGANIYAKNKHGLTPIYYALKKFRSCKIAKYLLTIVDIDNRKFPDVLGDCKESLRDLVGELYKTDLDLMEKLFFDTFLLKYEWNRYTCSIMG